MEASQVLERAVPGAVVDHDRPCRRPALGGQRSQAVGQPAQPVPVRDDDRNARRALARDHLIIVLARIGLAALAVLVCAWFVLGIRQAHDLARATAIVTSRSVGAEQATRASSLLSAAAELNPDSQVKLVRVALLFRTGATARAVALADQVTREEPMNPVAWQELAVVSYRDPAELAKALVHIRELSPPLAQSRH
jgi:hypothetical protein